MFRLMNFVPQIKGLIRNKKYRTFYFTNSAQIVDNESIESPKNRRPYPILGYGLRVNLVNKRCVALCLCGWLYRNKGFILSPFFEKDDPVC